jgi:hypothetical protein
MKTFQKLFSSPFLIANIRLSFAEILKELARE